MDTIERGVLNLPMEIFEKKGIFETRHMSEIEDDPYNTYFNLNGVLEELKVGLSDAVSDFDRQTLRYLCECVSYRAANLAGAGVAALINRLRRPNITVGMDGSVYKFHPHFGRLMKAAARRLVPNLFDFEMRLSEDGSGRGAALAVAAAVN